MKNDTAQVVRPATVGQLKDLIATMVQGIPGELSFEVAKDILSRKGELIAHVQGYFPDTSDLTNPVKQWEAFYQKAFGWSVSLSGVKIPERTPEQGKEFTRLLIIPGGLTNNQVYNACAKHFPCWRYTNDLDASVPTNERSPKDGVYAIWVRDTVEADEVHQNKSANMVKSAKLKTETLLERMLHELKYFMETGKHLDMSNWTLCSGSRNSGGSVPGADWGGDEFQVHWDSTDDRRGDLRSREVVS